MTDPPSPPSQRRAVDDAASVPAANDPPAQNEPRKRLAAALAGLTPAAGLGLLANILQVADAISAKNFELLWIIAGALAIILPSFVAWKVHWTEEPSIVVFFWISLLVSSFGAWNLGIINADSRPGPTALDVADTLCPLIAPSPKEPGLVRDCDPFYLLDGKQVDLDDPSSRGFHSSPDADVRLEGGKLLPASTDSRLYHVSAEPADGTSGMSYQGCTQAKKQDDAIDLLDMNALTAVCVTTNDGRHAILQLADYVPEDRSAVFAATCWSRPRR